MFEKTLFVALPVVAAAVVYAIARLRYAWCYEMARDDASKLVKDLARYARMTAAELVQKRLEEVQEELRDARRSVALLEEGEGRDYWSPDLFAGECLSTGAGLALAQARQDVSRLEAQEERIIEFKSRANAFQDEFLARLRGEINTAEQYQAYFRRIARRLGSRRARHLEPVVFGS